MSKRRLVFLWLLSLSLSISSPVVAEDSIVADDSFDEEESSADWRPERAKYQTSLFEDQEMRDVEREEGIPRAPDNSDLYQRLNQLQSEIDSLRNQPQTAGLQPGYRRSTDVPRVEDLKATPTFPKVRLTGF